jgi:group I intron endonuclease
MNDTTPRPVYIYTLSDPRTHRVRYVGKSTDPRERWRQHWSRARACRNHRECWLKGLRDAGLKPVVSVIETCSEIDWKARECYWIAHYRQLFPDLLNITDGGDGLENPTEETRAKISASLRGKKHSEETREKMRQAQIERYKDPSARAKLSESHKNQPPKSPEARAKISAAHKGKEISPEVRAKVSEGLKAYYSIPENRQKNSAAHAGQKVTAEARAKISAANKGRVKSEQERENIRASLTGRKLSESHREALRRVWVKRKANRPDPG